MDSLNPKVKSVSPPIDLRGQENFHYQHLHRQANASLSSGETYIAAFIPGKNHQQIFERAVVSFENHYYRSEIEDSQFEKFSRSIRAINTGMEEIRQYYKAKRQAFEYSFCILTVSGSEFLLSACGKTYIIAEDLNNRLHTVYSPEEFLDFSEVISGSTTQLVNMYLAVCSELYRPLQPDAKTLAHSILLVSQNRTELPWLALTLDYQTTAKTQAQAESKSKSKSSNYQKYFDIAKKTVGSYYSIAKSRVKSKQSSSVAVAEPSDSKSAKVSRKAKSSVQSMWNTIWSRYINPSPLRAIIVVGVIISAIIIGLIGWNIYQSNQKISSQYQQINSIYSQAQASKASQDTKTSENQYTQLLASISSLSAAQKTSLDKYAQSSRQTSLDDMVRNSQAQLDELHNIFHVTAQKVYTEDNFAYSLTTISGTVAYLLDPSTGKEVSYNLTNQKTSTKTSSSLNGANWLVSSPESPQVFATTPNKVFQIRSDLTTVEQKTSSPTWPNSQAIATYSGNLYFLMPSLGQIYRFRPTSGSQFGPQTSYLKAADAALKDSVALVVSGEVYTTTKTGQISKYSQGTPQTFTASRLPDLQSVILIGYRSDPEALILFDSTTQSFNYLAVQNNVASFKKALVVDNTTDITSFSLDEKNNLLYFVSKDGLYSIPLP